MKTGGKKVFITDCEGPLTKNDNAAELAEAFIPQGQVFFATISLYDDYLAEVIHKPGYKAGDTLRLILPFFKAFGLDHEGMTTFSGRNIAMIPRADRVLLELLDLVPSYIVSTSYSPYIKAVCDAVGFPFTNTFSTEVNLDQYELNGEEKGRLQEIHAEILDLPRLTLPPHASGPEDLTNDSRKTVQALDRIFWTEMPRMAIYRIVEDVNPIGGREKARAVKEIAASQGCDLRNVFYVGDSITDVDAFRVVKSAGGLALSFNGNDWAVKEASFAATAQNALPIGWLATLFLREGSEGFKDLMMSRIAAETVQEISKLSSRVRKEVRTEKIGSLG